MSELFLLDDYEIEVVESKLVEALDALEGYKKNKKKETFFLLARKIAAALDLVYDKLYEYDC